MPAAFNPIILIPARMASTRLPGKPLVPIHGEAMIVHVWRRAVEGDIGPVVVACADAEIADAIRAAGGRAELSQDTHASGSDRILEVLARIDPDGAFDVAVNLQGDMPTLDAGALAAVLEPLADPRFDIATLVSELAGPAELSDAGVVKAAVSFGPGALVGEATGFARDPALLGDAPLFHHVGVYAYRRAALVAFGERGPSAREKAAGLEQLRALDAGMTIGARLVDTHPFGVDTPADLAKAQAMMAATGAPSPPKD